MIERGDRTLLEIIYQTLWPNWNNKGIAAMANFELNHPKILYGLLTVNRKKTIQKKTIKSKRMHQKLLVTIKSATSGTLNI